MTTLTSNSLASGAPALSGRIVLTGATEAVAIGPGAVVARFSDTNTGDMASMFTAIIDWGDGTKEIGTVSGSNGSFIVTGSHSYADEGSFALDVTITDAAGTSLPLSGTVAVAEADQLMGNVPTLHLDPNQAFSGPVATFSDTNVSALSGDFAATIDWGDGSVTAGTVSGGNGAFTVGGNHTYTAGGTDIVTVTLADDAPGTAQATASGTAEVTQIGNFQFQLSAATEGVPLNNVPLVTFTDSNTADTAADFTATVFWFDTSSPPASSMSAGTITGGNGLFTISGSHTYPDEANVALDFSLTRKGQAVGTFGTPGTPISIADALLSALGATVTATEGTAGTLTVATFTDANPQATAADFTATIDWGDGFITTGTVVANNSGGFSVTGGHAYADEGQYKVGVAIVDDGGSTASIISTAN